MNVKCPYEEIAKQEEKSFKLLEELTCPKCNMFMTVVKVQKGIKKICSSIDECCYSEIEVNED